MRMSTVQFLCIVGESPLDDANELPDGFVLLDRTKLGHFDIFTDDAVEIVAYKVDYHQVLRDFFHATSKRLFCDGTCDTRSFPNGAFDRT